MITIKEPKIQLINDRARCTCPIDVDGINKEVWFEVDKEYGKYIVTERADAYVIGLLYWAMKNGHDITCECPVTEELLYNLSTILVPTLYKNAHNFHKTKIIAKNASEISGGGGRNRVFLRS